MTTSPPHGFMVLHSNQLEGLRDLMVQFIHNNPLPPLVPEVLLVQSNGMKHWLELALASDQALGICAATQIELPSAQLWKIYRAVLGPEVVPRQMPLDKSPLVWRLMRRLPALLNQPTFEPLARYLGNEGRGMPQGRRTYQLAAQLADVLDGYQNYRADWLDDWAQGRDVLRTSNAPSTPMSTTHQWQAALWRDLLHDLAQDTDRPAHQAHFQSRADVHSAFLNALQEVPAGARPAGVPPRLMVFGVSSLPMQTVEALAALGRVCQVLMLVQNPCQYFWGHVVESHRPLAAWSRQRQTHKTHLPQPSASGALTEELQYQLHTQTNPLLAAWGKQGRDYLHLLDGFDDVARYRHAFQRVDVFVDPCQTAREHKRTATRLAHLQSDLLNLNPPPEQPRPTPEHDQSIEFVQTHSAQREVEVLHDRLLSWLDQDPQLEPHHIMVMVPDMALFAPHIHAVFGRFSGNAARHIPYSVADTTPRTEPLVQALETLLQLPQLRITRLEWLSLFEVDAVRQRFGLDEADVAHIDQWLSQAGVRWGLDAPQRAAAGMDPALADADQNTWLFGLQRLLLGYASGATDPASSDTPHVWQDTLASPGVDGLDARLMGGLLQSLRAIDEALAPLQQSHTPDQWMTLLQSLVEHFFKPVEEREQRLLEKVMAPLEKWLADCQLARLDTPLPLVVVREHWLGQLQQPAMHQRFFGGGVQFATLMPMRSIPFKVMCLLGMNDGDYPRSQTPQDFDLMREDTLWRTGDRSRREDDRYLFLEALLSARDKLYISWQGRRTSDHEKMPPSVLVSQLSDYLNLAWDTPCEHPLQPLQAFSPQYFHQGSAFSTYADDWQMARHLTAPTPTPQGPSTPPQDIRLPQLRRLLKQPVEVFLRDRLNVTLDRPEEASPEEEPFGMNALERFKLTDAITHAKDAPAAIALLQRGGSLALAGFGQAQQNQLLKDRDTLMTRYAAKIDTWPLALTAQDLHLELGPHTLHAEWAHDPHTLWRSRADHSAWLQVVLRPGSVTEGNAKIKLPRAETLTDLWLNHLVACASGVATTSIQIGLNGEVQFNPMQVDQAKAHLLHLLALFDQAWDKPLPVARKTACAYLTAKRLQEPHPMHKAEQKFTGNRRQQGEFTESAALPCVFQHFEDIAPTLPEWAERLYGDMLDAAQLLGSTDTADHAEEAA